VFGKVVWATDGSYAADQALGAVKGLAESGSTVVIVHCQEMTMPGKGGGSFPVHADEDELQGKIASQARELGAGVRMAKTMIGGAAHAIAEIAEEENADLIVAGTRGHTAVGGLLMGSFTQRLLHQAPCPVLVVPADHHKG
jgi:nucleotide-binding universal stress UspA family protein